MDKGEPREEEQGGSTKQARENSVYIAFTDQVITRNVSWSLSLSLPSPCLSF